MVVEIQKFMNRKGYRRQEDLAADVGVEQSAVSSWNSGARTPKYEACRKLLLKGMTIEELFGKEVAEAVRLNEVSSVPDEYRDKLVNSIDFSDPVIQQVLGKILSEKLVIGLK